MALPTFVASGAFTSSVGAITPALPAGIQADDILVLVLETHQQAASIPTPNGGTWTQFPDSPQGFGTAGANSSSRVTVFWSRYNGTQGDPTTNDPGDHISGRISAFRGCETSGDPFDVTSGAAGDAAISIPGDTTTLADCLILVPVTSEDDGDSFSAFTNASLANITLRYENTHAQGDQGHVALWTGEKATAGAYNASTLTVSPSGEAWGGMTIALKPPVVTGNVPPGPNALMLLGVGQ